MDKIKEIIKEKDFVVNPVILKNIKNFNLGLEEFLLLIFFINVKNELNIQLIQKHISLSEEEAMKAFDLLIRKGLIEIVTSNIDGKIYEEVSLETFYNKLVLNIPQEKKSSDIYSSFENEFGRTLSPIEYETINKWLENNVSEETIKSALKEAVLNGVTNFRYIDKIIYEWSKKQIKTNHPKDEIQVFEYNWLEENNEGE